MDDTYTTLTVVSVDGSELVFDQVFKDMSIERFKRAVCMRKREPANAWENLKLFVNRREMENSRTLESYDLASGGIIQAVTSDESLSKAPTRAGSVAESLAGARAASVRSPPSYLQQPTSIRPPTFPPQPTFESPRTLRTVFITDENGRTHSLNEVPLDLDISNFQNLVGQKTGFDAASLRIIFGGKQFQPGKYTGRDCLSRMNTLMTMRWTDGKMAGLTLKDYGVQNVSGYTLILQSTSTPANIRGRRALFSSLDGYPAVSFNNMVSETDSPECFPFTLVQKPDNYCCP